MLKLKNILKFAFLYFYMFEFGGLHWSPLINTSLPLPFSVLLSEPFLSMAIGPSV